MPSESRRVTRRHWRRLTKANLRFVVSVAKQYQNQGLSLPDLINEETSVLSRLRRSSTKPGVSSLFRMPCGGFVSRSCKALAEQSRIVRLPLNQVGSLNKINKAFARFEQEHERTPSPEELANELGFPRRR